MINIQNIIPDMNKLMLINQYNQQIIDLQFKIQNLENSLYENNTTPTILYKLTDLFEIIKLSTFNVNNSITGNIPLYGATKNNIPIKYINKYSIDTFNSNDDLIKQFGVLCINKTGDGGAGISFIRKGKFAVSSTILCCKIKKRNKRY